MPTIPEVNEPIELTYGGFTWDYINGYPTPKVTWVNERKRNSAGAYLSSELSVNIQGFVSRKDLDYYANDQGKKTFDVLMKDAQTLRDSVIAADGGLFLFKYANQTLVSGSARLETLEFSPNAKKWTNTIDYSLSLQISVTGTGFMPGTTETTSMHITDCSNTITIEPEGRKYIVSGNPYELYRLSRNVSARAKAYADVEKGALTFAKGYVSEIAYDFSGIIAPSFRLYNRTSTVELSETEGSYSVQDQYILKSGDAWLHTEQVDISTDRDSDLRTVNIAGEVEGLEPATGLIVTHTGMLHNSGLLDISGVNPIHEYTKGYKYNFGPAEEGEEGSSEIVTKYENAVSGYMKIVDNFFESALTYDDDAKLLDTNISSRPLHGIPVSTEEGYSPQQGRISYSRSYNSRPTGLLKDALFENLTLSDSKPQSLITPVPVIGRRLGPLYYNPQGFSNVRNAKFASGVGNRTISYEAFFPKYTGLKNYKFPQEIIDKIDSYLHLYEPKGKYSGFIKNNTQELDLTENRLSKSITWEYIECNPN